MRLEPECPRCSARVSGTGESWVCPTHEVVTPLWRAREPEYDAFAEYLMLSRPLPSWLPWPLPPGWQVSDFGCVAHEGRPPRAGFVSCAGPTDVDGVVELTVLSEEPGVGLGARVAGVTHTDPGREVGVGPSTARVRLESSSVAIWPVSVSGEGDALDRAVFAGEAGGRWIWLVLRPAPAALMLQEMGALVDVSSLGPPLLSMPFGTGPRSW